MKDEMTTITIAMNRIGDLKGTVATGVIYQDGDVFFYQMSGWTIKDFDEMSFEKESERFSSLRELLLSVPVTVRFQPEGYNETKEEFFAQMHRFLKMTRTPGGYDLMEKIRREHDVYTIKEIGDIFETRKGELPDRIVAA